MFGQIAPFCVSKTQGSGRKNFPHLKLIISTGTTNAIRQEV